MFKIDGFIVNVQHIEGQLFAWNFSCKFPLVLNIDRLSAHCQPFSPERSRKFGLIVRLLVISLVLSLYSVICWDTSCVVHEIVLGVSNESVGYSATGNSNLTFKCAGNAGPGFEHDFKDLTDGQDALLNKNSASVDLCGFSAAVSGENKTGQALACATRASKICD